MNINKEIRERTNKELIEVIESQDFWNSDEMKEFLWRARIEPGSYPEDAEPEDLYEDALIALGIKKGYTYKRKGGDKDCTARG